MLGSTDPHAAREPAAAAGPAQAAGDGEIVGLGAARGEDDLPRLRPRQLGDLPPCLLYALARPPPEAVDGRGVAELVQHLLHGRPRGGEEGCRRVVVQIDRLLAHAPGIRRHARGRTRTRAIVGGGGRVGRRTGGCVSLRLHRCLGYLARRAGVCAEVCPLFGTLPPAMHRVNCRVVCGALLCAPRLSRAPPSRALFGAAHGGGGCGALVAR